MLASAARFVTLGLLVTSCAGRPPATAGSPAADPAGLAKAVVAAPDRAHADRALDARDWSASPGAAGEKRGTSDRFCLRFVKDAS